LIVDWWSYRKNLSVKKMKSTASAETGATIFFAQIRRDAVCRREFLLGSALLQISYYGNKSWFIAA